MQKNKPDEFDFLASLPSLEGYTPMDRYRDFRKVFGTVEGKKVMKEILSWGRIFRASTMGNPIDPNRMAIMFGERNIALKLLTTFTHEPTEQNKQIRRKTP